MSTAPDLPDYFSLTELIQQLSAEIGRDFSVEWDSGVVAAAALASTLITVPADRDYYVTQAYCASLAAVAMTQHVHFEIQNLTDAIRWALAQAEQYHSIFLPFTKPFRATAGQQIQLQVVNFGAANGRWVSGFAGYYILV